MSKKPSRKAASAAVASIAQIARSLESPDPAVRVGAMQHAAARGTDANALAARIAQAITDPDPAVSWHVPRTFAAVGRGAVEALAVLMPLLDDVDEMRRTRAMYCIGAIGPGATVAIPKLTTMSDGGGRHATAALEALAGLAGDTPQDAISVPLLAALAADDYGRSSAAARALAAAPAWLAARGLAQLAETLAPEMNGSTLLVDLAPRLADEVRPVIERALAIGGPTSLLAMLAVETLAGPIPESIVHTLLALAGRGKGSAGRALACVAPKLPPGAYASAATAALPPAIASARELRDAGSLGRALGALAPRSGAAAQDLLARFETNIDKPPERDSWYALGDLACAIAQLADAGCADRAAGTLRRALDGSSHRLRLDESAGLDLDRALKEALGTLGAISPLAKRTAKKKLAVDAIDAERARAERSPKLAAIPKARKASPAPSVRVLSPKERATIARAVGAGRRVAKEEASITARSSADAVASVVDRAVRAMRRAKEHDLRRAGDLGALFGDAIVRGGAWRWRVWTEGARASFAVVSPTGFHAVLPIELVLAQLKPRSEVTLLLLFRMILAGDLPRTPGRTPVLLA